jgi:signal transduction histidine kinase
MAKLFWGSLRSRILLLAVLTCLFLAGAAFSLFAFLRSSHAATLSTAEHHLIGVASSLARSYSEQEASTVSLRDITPRVPPPPRPPPAGPPDLLPEPPEPPPPSAAEAALARFTAAALQREPGIEGGFFAAGSGALLGYAFPTHEGPGPTKDVPQRERPTIESLVREAVATNSIRTFRFEGAHDAVLFVAVPVAETHSINGSTPASQITGAVWLMERLPGINGGRSRELLIGSSGFLSAAIITALLAFFVMREVRSGVAAVLSRLSSLEGGLNGGGQQAAPHPQLEEFDRVLRGIDGLAYSLQQKIENERQLEAQMRHKERLSALGQFAAGVAHELRNPLATLRLRTQMTQRSADPEVVQRNSRVILEEIDRLDTIIGRLLYFARPIHLHLQPVALDDLCATTVANWNARRLSGNVELICAANSGVVVLCDRNQMLQVLDNLIENAVQSVSNSPRGKVVIETAQRGNLAEIQVRDNGIGLNPEVLKHAFDPFFTTKQNGTGLGLSISFELIQAHGGELQMANQKSGGAVVCIGLPLDPRSADRPQPLPAQISEDQLSNG